VFFPLPERVVTLGRDPGNDVVVNLAQVALRQAEIVREGTRWVVNNVGGGEGLRVSFSGDPAQARPVPARNALKAGSTIHVGNVVLELQETEGSWVTG
jgi:pSer/pThr/pTyr-binding forkhead associated (FHA) protein